MGQKHVQTTMGTGPNVPASAHQWTRPAGPRISHICHHHTPDAQLAHQSFRMALGSSPTIDSVKRALLRKALPPIACDILQGA